MFVPSDMPTKKSLLLKQFPFTVVTFFKSANSTENMTETAKG
jgi:hypothetical protein